MNLRRFSGFRQQALLSSALGFLRALLRLLLRSVLVPLGTKSDFRHFQNFLFGENVYTFQKPKMQHQLSTIRSGKTSQGARLQNFHLAVLSRLFLVHVLLRARVLLSLVCFFCQLFPSGDFLGVFFPLRFHFWSWFRDLFFSSRQFLIFVNSCCCYAGLSVSYFI